MGLDELVVRDLDVGVGHDPLHPHPRHRHARHQAQAGPGEHLRRPGLHLSHHQHHRLRPHSLRHTVSLHIGF